MKRRQTTPTSDRHISRSRIKYILVILDTVVQQCCIFLITKFFGHKIACIVIVCIFQRARYLFCYMKRFTHRVFQRYIAVLEIRIECPSSQSVFILFIRFRLFKGILAHRTISLLDIELAYALEIGICDE